MGIIDDPVSGTLRVIFKHFEDSQWWKWLQLLFSVSATAFVVFTGVLGIELVAKAVIPVAIGYALIATSISVLTVLTHDPRGRVLMLAIPKNVIAVYQQAANGEAGQGMTVIEPSKK